MAEPQADWRLLSNPSVVNNVDSPHHGVILKYGDFSEGARPAVEVWLRRSFIETEPSLDALPPDSVFPAAVFGQMPPFQIRNGQLMSDALDALEVLRANPGMEGLSKTIELIEKVPGMSGAQRPTGSPRANEALLPRRRRDLG
jgi:hypothetical protein